MSVPTLEVRSFKEATLDGRGALDLLQNRVVLLTGVAPLVRMSGDVVLTDYRPTDVQRRSENTIAVNGAFDNPQGEGVEASVTWTATEEGLRCEVHCRGAQAVGLSGAYPGSSHIFMSSCGWPDTSIPHT